MTFITLSVGTDLQLLGIANKIVFVHDDFIYASVTAGQIYRELPSIILRSMDDKTFNNTVFKHLLNIMGDDKTRAKDLYGPSPDETDKRLRGFIEEYNSARPSSSIEYCLRGLPREILVDLISRDLIWVIPYDKIESIKVRKVGTHKIIEIIYLCPYTMTRRALRLLYNEDFYRLVMSLIGEKNEHVHRTS